MITQFHRLKRFRIHAGQQDQLPVRLNSRLRQAQLSGTALSKSARAFTITQLHELEAFRPQVLIGSHSDLQILAELSSSGKCDLGSIDYTLIAVTGNGEECLSDLSRVILWQAFGVPVYEVLVDSDGLLLAAECEAHEGWHVRAGLRASISGGKVFMHRGNRKPIFTGYMGEIDTTACACRRQTARILNARPFLRALDVNQTALAAIA